MTSKQKAQADTNNHYAMEDLRTLCETLRGGGLAAQDVEECSVATGYFVDGELCEMTVSVVEAIWQLLGYIEDCCPAVAKAKNETKGGTK